MKRPMCAGACLLLLALPATAQEKVERVEKPEDAAIHQELIALRDDALDALNKNEIDRLLTHVHPQVVLTAPSPEAGKEVSRGKEGVKAYFDKMFTGPDRRADSMTSEVKVDELSLLYGGDTASAWGSSNDTYKMRNGSLFKLRTRWSSTLVKEGDRWLIAEFHVSVNMFDNPLVTMTAQWVAWISGGLAGGVGLVLGVILGWLWKRKR